jgi:glycosyltransferase involved in cell wall biosynthesis
MYGVKAATGIGGYIQNLIDQLAEIDSENEYILFMNDPAFSEFRPPTSKFKKIKVNIRWYSWVEQLIFPIILYKHCLNLIHFPNFNTPIFYFKKSVITIHDITPIFYPGPMVKKSKIRRLAYWLVLRLSILKAKVVITPSNHTKDGIVKYLKVKTKKIKVVYLGFDSKLVNRSSQMEIDQVLSKYAITKPYLLYLGVWRDHKNLVGLIKAFEILKIKNQLDCQLVLGGKADPNYPEISQAISESPVKNQIIAPGFIPEEELGLIYQGAKLFVLPSFCEGFGLVALEAIYCQTPVVSSQSTSLPEVLGDSAVYFDPTNPEDIAQKVLEVIGNKNLINTMVDRGQKQLLKYDWRQCAQVTLDIYLAA